MKKISVILSAVFLLGFLAFNFIGGGALLNTTYYSTASDTVAVASDTSHQFTNDGYYPTIILEYGTVVTGPFKMLTINYDCSKIDYFRTNTASDSTTTIEGKISGGTTWVQLPFFNYTVTTETRTFTLTAASYLRFRGYK